MRDERVSLLSMDTMSAVEQREKSQIIITITSEVNWIFEEHTPCAPAMILDVGGGACKN